MVDIKDFIGWFIALIATNGVLIVGAIFGWVWKGRQNKRELQSADLKLIKERQDAIKILKEYGDETTVENLDLHQQVRLLNARMTGLECQVQCLSAQLREAGIKPVTLEEALARNCK